MEEVIMEPSAETTGKIHESCKNPVEITTVRKWSERIWGVFITLAVVFIGSLVTIFVLIFNAGGEVGRAQGEIDYLQINQAKQGQAIQQIRVEMLEQERINGQRHQAVLNAVNKVATDQAVIKQELVNVNRGNRRKR
jgi:hypothetical protein